MRLDREWVDTAFLHALRQAHGVTVLIVQADTDEALVGGDLVENMGKGLCPNPIMVPVALVNDHHFWGVVPCADEMAIGPVDKGEHAALRSHAGQP